jgi:hypothetical protein
MSLMMGWICYAILGLFFLACIPALRLMFSNLFVAGAFPVGLALLFLDGRVFAKNKLSKVFDGTNWMEKKKK